VHVKIDTGTGRLGSQPQTARSLLRAALRSSRLRLVGVFTHFADAEDESDGFTLRQLRLLQNLTTDIPASVERHAACTAAALRFPPTFLDFVRLGIGLYGLWPSRKSRVAGVQLEPALSWRTRVLQVKRVPKGTSVGYGRTFRTKRASNLAVLPVGYADGYPRAASNRGVVLLNARPCPVVGRVSMNLIVVDASGAGPLRSGAPAVLIGRQGRAEISAEALAAVSGTIHYELVTRIAANVPRVLV
jgi:alanine racemase